MSASQLYGRDYYAWVQAQADALRERRIEDVDWENVAEEIEDLGKSENAPCAASWRGLSNICSSSNTRR